jgi:hypothetical protein
MPRFEASMTRCLKGVKLLDSLDYMLQRVHNYWGTEWPQHVWKPVFAVFSHSKRSKKVTYGPGKKKEEAKLPPLCRAKRELVADRTRSSNNGRNADARAGCSADWHTRTGSGIDHELDHARLIVAEGPYTRRLRRDWSGVHFEAVVDSSHWKSSGGGEYITALGVRSNAQEGVD